MAKGFESAKANSGSKSHGAYKTTAAAKAAIAKAPAGGEGATRPKADPVCYGMYANPKGK